MGPDTKGRLIRFLHIPGVNQVPEGTSVPVTIPERPAESSPSQLSHMCPNKGMVIAPRDLCKLQLQPSLIRGIRSLKQWSACSHLLWRAVRVFRARAPRLRAVPEEPSTALPTTFIGASQHAGVDARISRSAFPGGKRDGTREKF